MRKTLTTAFAVLALLSLVGVSQASIIAAGAWDDGDGGVVCNTANWDSGQYTMTITGNQYFGPGHIGTLPLSSTAYFTTDTELDPTVTLRTTMDNDTGFSWTGYHVSVYMNKSFTLTLPTVYTPDTSEPGWHVASYVSDAVQSGEVWVASVDFAGGTPIPDGGTLDFSYKLSFIGSVQYCQEMTPVPEPGAIALVLCGLAGVLVLRRKLAA